ncbi:MAG: hypothetical protein IPN78_00155 [Candidatus Accumulibacter sp.]|nr:hypothetical protein [Candidatus Accumulibacter propinquus]
MPPQEPINIYRDLLGVMPRFNAPENSITFAADCLIRPISNADPELRRLMQEQVQRLDNLYQDELPERVAPLIRNLLAQGTASLDVIAQRLAMSPRTLQRGGGSGGTSAEQGAQNSGERARHQRGRGGGRKKGGGRRGGRGECGG